MKRQIHLLSVLFLLLLAACTPSEGPTSSITPSDRITDTVTVTTDTVTVTTDTVTVTTDTVTVTTDTGSISTDTDYGTDSANTLTDTDPGTDTNPPEAPKGILTAAVLRKKDNPALDKDLHFEIDAESRIATLTLDYQNYADIATLQRAVLRTEGEFGTVSFPKNEDGTVNLLNGLVCTVTDENGNKADYRLQVNRAAYQIPVISITLSKGKDAEDIARTETMEMTFTMDGTPVGAEEIFSVTGTIRGRGNSTWTWEKKPYKIKFDEKISILGMEENRDWILLANYADKSLIRNTLAYEMGRVLDNVQWSPHQYPVDLFINGIYCGVYAIGEHMEVAKDRVEITEGADVDVGYLIEVGGMEDGDTIGQDGFHTVYGLVCFAAFKSPDKDEITKEQRNYIRNYFQKAEDAIMTGQNYEEYIDVDSFVDWILLHELTYNLDSCFRRSCYLTKPAGEKLKMGPIWDFDLAFGNFSQDKKAYDNWITVGSADTDAYIKENWCTYLMKDPAFRKKLRERWEEIRTPLLETAYATIDKYSALLDGSQQENFKVWQIWNERSGYQSKWCSEANTYEKQIKYLKDFLKKRAAWLDKNV